MVRTPNRSKNLEKMIVAFAQAMKNKNTKRGYVMAKAIKKKTSPKKAPGAPKKAIRKPTKTKLRTARRLFPSPNKN